MKITTLILSAAIASLSLLLPGCRGGSAATAVSAPAVSQAIPRAVIYRTSGDYNDNVPVTLDASRQRIISYPAPSDITPASTPVVLTDGWLLDRRGISPGSAFTRYTYGEYASLPAVPTAAQLMEAIIPQAIVTEIRRLPLSINEAQADTALCNRLITRSPDECPIIYQAPILKM